MAKHLRKKPARKQAGRALEEAVARVQQRLDPNSRVTHDEKMTDRVGIVRQFDVVIRGQFAGRDCLGVIECKDHSRKGGLGDVEAFAKKTDNLGANIRLMVARKGFTDSALKLASFEHIACLSLLSPQTPVPGHSIGEWWYGEIARWTQWRLIVHFVTPPKPGELEPLVGDSVRWQGKPVSRWFLRELFTARATETREGEHQITIAFSEPRELEIGHDRYLVKGLSCDAIRVYRKKRKWVTWWGDGFYDWHDGKYLVPQGGQIGSTWVETDISKWDDYSGEIPGDSSSNVQPFLRWVVFRDSDKWDGSEDVVDLTSL
jgi:hypothetical protein